MSLTDRVEPAGLLVAVSGFAITRLFVAETLRIDAALPFLFAGVLPLVVGLGLSVYGVALAVGPFATEYVNTVARWHALGIAAMAVVLGITAIDQSLRTGAAAVSVESPLLAANVLLGGAVGGTLTGIRSGKVLRHQREIRRSANRALLVNRLLKHEVLNAITIIDGHADLLSDSDRDRPASTAAIRRAVERIRATIDEVEVVARDNGRTGRTDLEEIVRDEVAALRGSHDVDPRVDVHAADTETAVDDRVALVVRELLQNAASHGESASLTVEISETAHAIELSIADDGSGLPERQRALLERGEFPEFDDPSAGFGLQVVRLLVVQFGGDIRVSTANGDGSGTKITVVLPRDEREGISPETIGLGVPTLLGAIAGGILGGVAMGVFFQVATGVLPVIGSLYGIQSPLVGWITHLFHSVVFGLLFAAGSATPRARRVASGAVGSGLLGVGWGIALWLVAAGLLMPVWLRLLGIPAPVPNLTLTGLLAHALWGAVLGVSYRWVSDAGLVDR
ncbi:histidine kinase [Halorubrum sp. CBA1125]|uniref:ATP-binding protein n=1 Tax=Halorubrum sp. CBA1125 TaxID=2668072 RepID=UPI0012E8BB6D|nr:HAMP domain-containing sensor histidine kinase [Halorubrum sp. CBA1125]MUW13662.1 histidine kinase [Halorubrum sp. CBA1125]